MRLSEARLKEIIRQEVERRLMEAIVDDLILEEVKKMGLNEDDWQKAKKGTPNASRCRRFRSRRRMDR